jgi:molybdenum cofactor synthesis domain-containing protein
VSASLPARARVITVSDSRGPAEDRSGPVLVELLAGHGAEVVGRTVIPDERPAIEAAIVAACDDADLVLTCGGTGLAPRDVTPEATLAVLDRLAPGFGEAMRAAAMAASPHGMLSRAVAGTRGRTLVVNLPGSPRACRESFAVIAPALAHALGLLSGGPAREGHREPWA